MSEFIVADASLAFKWLVEEENSGRATAIARFWSNQGLRLAAPCFMPTEVTSILHRRVVRGELTIAAAAGLVRDLLSLGIELHETPHLHTRALELASQLNQGAAMTRTTWHWRRPWAASCGPPARGSNGRPAQSPGTCAGLESSPRQDSRQGSC